MPEQKQKTTRKRKSTKKRSVVDSAARNAAVLTDGCNPEFVSGASFDGIFEIPIIKKPKRFVIPKNLVPFSKLAKADPKTFAVCEYENDSQFKDILSHPNDYITTLKEYQGFISPDCSLYRDMPLAIQITNVYRNRAIGYFFQKHGIYVIPCVRWGDERTYTKKFLPERIAFSGVEKNSIVSVGSYGQLKDRINRYYFEAGMDAMMETLEPQIVLVYSKMPDSIEDKYPQTKFIEYPDWTSSKKEDTDNGRRTE